MSPPLPMPPCDYCPNPAEIGLNVSIYPLDNVSREFETPLGPALVPFKGNVRMCLSCIVRMGFLAQRFVEKGKERTS